MSDTQPAAWRSIATRVALYLLTAALGMAAARFGFPPPPQLVEVERRVEVPAAAAAPPPATGWVADPAEVAAVVARVNPPVFADTPAGRAEDLPPAVYLWKAYERLPARGPPVKNQGQVGSCVSFGTNAAVERTLAAQVAGGQPWEWVRFAEEATYGGSRVEVGGGRIRGDGSVGAWAAEFVTRWGLIPRDRYDGADLTAYDEARCRLWGDRGVPDALEAVARKFPVKDTTRITAWADAKKALASGYGIAVCSNQGFAMRRDANGVARASGSWAHCMCLDGYHTDGGREYGHITNSWGGTAHAGPVGWGNPNPDGFWAEAAVVDRMLRQGDSWAFSGATGFPRRVLPDWFIRADPPRPDALALAVPARRPALDPRRRMALTRPSVARADPASVGW
jgi:hypothetical protein